MILFELKRYLADRRRVDLADICNRFDVDAEALRGMLDQWIRKGRVRRISDAGTCGGCCGCNTPTAEVYEWIG